MFHFVLSFKGIWIYVLVYFIVKIVVFKLLPMAVSDRFGEIPFKNNYTFFSQALQWTIFLISIFTPIHDFLLWYILGNLLFVIGLGGILSAIFAFASTPANYIVGNGIYKYFRHPVYLSAFVMWFGTFLMSFSFFILLFATLQFIISLKIARQEEQFCLKKFPDQYEDYLTKVKTFGIF